MSKETRGRKPIKIIESTPYSNIIFLIASGVNYPEAISKARNKDSSSTVKQLETLKNAKFLNDPKKEKLLNKTIYSINWRKIIEELVKYLEENVDYVCSENDRLKLNLNNIGRFKEIVERARDKNFKNSLKGNKLLYAFFEQYYATIGRLRENWTIISTFDFLSFFGNLNFVHLLGASHNFYNIEKLFHLINSREMKTFPDWIIKEKKPKTEKEEFEKFKKLRTHTYTNFDQEVERTKKQVDEVIHKYKEVTDLFILSSVLEIVKIKPSLQLGLSNAVKETGKNIFLQVFTKEQINQYFELTSQCNLFGSIEVEEQIQQDLKEILVANDLKVAKTTENTPKSGVQIK